MTTKALFAEITLHNWKRFYRSTVFQQKLIGRIFSYLVILYFIVLFFLFGYNLDVVIAKIFPGENSQKIINMYILYFFFIFLLIRFFIQKLPRINLMPYLPLAISKKKLCLIYSLFFFLNIQNYIPLIIIIPYWIKNRNTFLSTESSILWLVGYIVLAYGFNFLTLYIKIQFFKKPVWFVIIVALALCIPLMGDFGINDFISHFSGWLFNGFLHSASAYQLLIIPILMTSIIFYIIYRSIKGSLYIE